HIYLDLMDDPAMALKYAEKEYSRRPDNIDVNRMMAKIYAVQEDEINKEKYLAAARRTNSKHPELLTIQSNSLSLKM
ncbi:MAG: hypothetical protein WBO36_14555, partial [Saprospiraceae bacterium]